MDIIKNEGSTIKLLVTRNSGPNWQLMENFIKNLLYADKI